MNLNLKVSKCLFYTSELLSKKKGDEGKARAYKNASLSIQRLKKPIDFFSTEEELDEIPYIGKTISQNILDYMHSGRFQLLEKLLRNARPQDILMLASGVSKFKANEIVDFLVIENYDDIMRDFSNGRFSLFFDKNSKIYKAIGELLDILPGWFSLDKRGQESLKEVKPKTEDLLRFDASFREDFPYYKNPKATYQKVFNNGVITLNYSYSRNAIQNKKLGDWVSIKFEFEDYALKWVILTSAFGPLKGKRIVMGEEKNSESFMVAG